MHDITNYLFVLSILYRSDSGIAIVSATSAREAFTVLQRQGVYNGNPNDYILVQSKNIGMYKQERVTLVYESYTNALVAYDAIVSVMEDLHLESPIEHIKVNGTELEIDDKTVNITVPTSLADLSSDVSHRTVTDIEKSIWNNKADASAIPDVSGKADRVQSAVAGHIATLDSSGNLVDSGKGISDINPLWGNIQGSIENQTDLMSALGDKYEKPSTGIPASDLADGVIPDISGKADAATTLAGYGITDAYTKTETDAKMSAVYKPAGNVDFINQLGALTAENLGKVYNVLNGFTTTSNFMEGSGKKYPAGTNVVIVQTGSSQNPTYKYDVLAGFVDLSPYAVKSVVNAELDKKQGYSCGMSLPNNPKEGDVFELLQELEIVSNDDYNEITIPAEDEEDESWTMGDALQLDVPEGASGVICTSLVAQFDRWYEVFNLTTEEVIELDGNIWTQNAICNFPNGTIGSAFAKLPAGCTSLVLADDFTSGSLDLTEISITFAGNPTLYQYTNGSWVKCLTEAERTAWNAKYDKPASGIPASDLANDAVPIETIKVNGTAQTVVNKAVNITVPKVTVNTENYWLNHGTYVPELGEIVAYIYDNNASPLIQNNIKIGDGRTQIQWIPFCCPVIDTDLGDPVEWYDFKNETYKLGSYGFGLEEDYDENTPEDEVAFFNAIGITEYGSYEINGTLCTVGSYDIGLVQFVNIDWGDSPVISGTYIRYGSRFPGSPVTWTAPKMIYEIPLTGIPKTDLASGVQTSLGKADTAYQKPSDGIPKTDLASAVQTSLGKADTALQSFTETDPTVPSWAKASSKPSYEYSEINNTPTIPDAVEANPTVPSGTTPTALTGLKIGNSYYSAPSVVALTNNEIDTIWTNAS